MHQCIECGEHRELEDFYWSKGSDGEVHRFFERPCRICRMAYGVTDDRIANHRSLALTRAQRGGSAFRRRG